MPRSIGTVKERELQAEFYVGRRYIYVGDAPPPLPWQEGDLWVDTSSKETKLKLYKEG